MLYPNAWRVNQLYQNPVFPYGLGMLTESEASGQYGSAGIAVDDLVLTSRVRVSIDYDAPLATSFAEMRKILQSVLPARLTPEFSTKIDVSTGGVGIDQTLLALLISSKCQRHSIAALSLGRLLRKRSSS